MKTNDLILLAEDDTLDQKAVIRAFRDLKIVNPLKIVENGEQALSFLKQSATTLPSLILLDLNMPRMNGLELLNIIKHDEALKQIPVIVLTTSSEDSDRAQSFELNVAGYMIKPIEYKEFIELIKTLYSYWSTSVMPPERRMKQAG